MRFVTIVGDSVSTYEGYNPQGYSVFYDEVMQRENGLKSVYDTWWAKVNQALYGLLCVNNSYSGSKVSGGEFPAATSEQRINMLQTREFSPDYILIYIGFNDFGNGVPVSTNHTTFGLSGNYDFFEDAYDIMLQKIMLKIPTAKIICGTIMRTEIKGKEAWRFPEHYGGIGLEDYNDAIRKVAKRNNCIVADVSSLGMKYETLDGSHPTANGHQTIAEAWIRCLADLDLLKPSIETCIKMYNANRDNYICFDMVLDALFKERVLMMFNESEKIIGITRNGKTIIPVFTSPNEVKHIDSVQVRTVLLADYMEKIKFLKLDLMVNPYSQASKQCIIPYTALV